MRCLALNASSSQLTMVPVRRALRLCFHLWQGMRCRGGGPRRSFGANGWYHARLSSGWSASSTSLAASAAKSPTRSCLLATTTAAVLRGRSQQELRQRECLTRDHLVPLSRGGTNAWANVLTACSSCNTRKGNLLPEEVGMHPLRAPHEPHFVHLSWAVRRLTRTQAKYIRLFYGADVLATLEAL